MKVAFKVIKRNDATLDYFFKRHDGEYCLSLVALPQENGNVDIHVLLSNLSTQKTIKDENTVNYFTSQLYSQFRKHFWN